MKQNIHPDYLQMVVTCACGNTFTVGGSRPTLHVDVCHKCHPFITGTQKFIDAMGRVEKFTAKRQAASGYVKKSKKGQEAIDKTPKSLKEMLDAKKKLSKVEPVTEDVTTEA